MATSKKFPPGTWVTIIDNEITANWGENYNVYPGNPYMAEAPNEGNERRHGDNFSSGPWVWLTYQRDNGKQDQVGLIEKWFVPVNEHNPMPEPDFSLDEVHAAVETYSALTKDKSCA